MAPKPAICVEKERLSQQLYNALTAVTFLQNAEATDLIHGGDGLPRMDLALAAARERWGKARLAYAAHLQEHGCA